MSIQNDTRYAIMDETTWWLVGSHWFWLLEGRVEFSCRENSLLAADIRRGFAQASVNPPPIGLRQQIVPQVLLGISCIGGHR